jgi:sec-independent protein translocase protein TatB
MFDLGFGELVVIAIVLLVVVGPERLPGVARTAGHLLGRARRYVAGVKSDIQREIQIDELKKLQKQAQNFDQTMRAEMREIQSDIQGALPSAEHGSASPDAPGDPAGYPPLDAPARAVVSRENVVVTDVASGADAGSVADAEMPDLQLRLDLDSATPVAVAPSAQNDADEGVIPRAVAESMPCLDEKIPVAAAPRSIGDVAAAAAVSAATATLVNKA